eukprot:SAG11_NODE_202_length_12550_cov_5.549835_1_plen_83_part_00
MKVTLGTAKVCNTDTCNMKPCMYNNTGVRVPRTTGPRIHRGADTEGILLLSVLVFHSTRTQVKVHRKYYIIPVYVIMTKCMH